MKKRYVYKSHNISSQIIKFISSHGSVETGNEIKIINKSIEDFYKIESGSEILVPVLFKEDIYGRFEIADKLISNELIYSLDAGNKYIFLIYFQDAPLEINKIISFANGSLETQDGSYDEVLGGCFLSQKSILKEFSNFPMGKNSINKFFNFYNSIDLSLEPKNTDFYILEKLDHINQEVKTIRELPFFLRTNSMSYRSLMPLLNLVRYVKIKAVNLVNKIPTKFQNYKERFAYTETPNPTVNSFLNIAKMKINPKLIKIKQSKNPDLSIIIPVYGKLDFLGRCLHSIQKAKTDVSFEVIVVDDCGPDSVSTKFNEKDNGFTIIKNKKNEGFTTTCNNGSKKAKGKYLCFLNSDAIVTDYWSDSLLNGFKLASNVGIVGPRLIFENGKLQESGGIVFSNGEAANIGREEKLDNSWFKYFKDVDYVSGAALTISSVDFQELGGFDKRFTPAYYEDTSLCLDMRHKLGKRVVVNPLSNVIHHEGATNGTDENSGFKKFMGINKEKFIEKHASDLLNYGESFANIWWDRDKYIKGNVLIIDQCIPTPKEDSGSKDMDNILRSLLDQNYRPHFFALSNRGETPESYGYYEKGVHCVFGKENLNFHDFIKKYNSLFKLIIVSRVNSYKEVERSLKEFCSDIKTIFYTVDLHHVRLESEFQITQDSELLSEVRKAKIGEIQAIAKTDKTIVLSNKERNYLVSSNGIDAEKISIWPLIRSEFESIDKFKKDLNAKDIIFIGGFRHHPNIEAVKLLEKEIIPKAKEIFLKNGLEFPGVKIYGSSPTPYIEKLKNKDISYEGFIDKEEDAFKNAKISLAPLPFGSGMKGKTLSSLIFSTPVVGTSFAFEGFEIINKRIMSLSSLDTDIFAQKIFDTYTETDNIEKDEWAALMKDLKERFSYSSFNRKMTSDLSELLEEKAY